MRLFQMKSHLVAMIVALSCLYDSEMAIAQQTWSEQTTAAAMGYCLARHPYIPRDPANPFTTDGFEILQSPGVLGAVRRNYIMQRPTASVTTPDAGQNQSCAQACGQFGMNYGSNQGKPLRYRDPSGNTVADGIGDMASLAYRDFDFYNNQSVIAGMWGRPLNFHESDVAQADFCCCQLDTSGRPPQKACVYFEQPLIVGTHFGPTVGQNPGDIVHSENGIQMTVEKFVWTNGNTAFGDSYADSLLVPGAVAQSLRINNMNMKFDFSALTFVTNRVTLFYTDFGGSENLAANDDAPLNDDIEQMSLATVGGSTVTVSPGSATGSSRSGMIELVGGLKSVAIGGQELWIDQVCAEP